MILVHFIFKIYLFSNTTYKQMFVKWILGQHKYQQNQVFSAPHGGSTGFPRQFSSAPYQIKFNPTVLVGLNFMGRATRLYI